MRRPHKSGHQGRGMPIPESNELFIEEAKQARAEFAGSLGLYSVTLNKELRTKADTVLIMYDQMVERLTP